MDEVTNKYSIDDLVHLMERLRDPVDGCPWDLKQSYETIVPSTIEEAYEVADAIERGDIDALREELGDLMFQAVFYSQLASEERRFTLLEVISDLVAKLVRRHPHVFPDGTLISRARDTGDSNSQANHEPGPSDEGASLSSDITVKEQWEEIKSGERAVKGLHSQMDDIPKAFPALLRAHKLQKRAAKVGFDWGENQGVFDKLQEEITEIEEAIADSNGQKSSAVEEELGDLLFTCVNLTRRLGYDSETALRKASSKFENRFRTMEKTVEKNTGQKAASKGLRAMSPAQLEELWCEAKKLTKQTDES